MPQKILSDNKKCGCSINLPIKGHCKPTTQCAKDCYAKTGPISWGYPEAKKLWVSKYLTENNLERLIQECLGRSSVRLSGSGDLNKNHVPAIISLAKACPRTTFWGMTRKPEIAKKINGADLPNLSILVTVDPTSPKSVWNYQGKMCFGPRRPTDQVPNDPRIVTVFPRHFAGQVIKDTPHHPKDCKAVWHEISGCLECGQCWK